MTGGKKKSEGIVFDIPTEKIPVSEYERNISERDLRIKKKTDHREIVHKEIGIDTSAFPKNIQKRIDLHGFNAREATAELNNFLISAYHDGFKYLLVITGKGNNSPGKKSIIKALVEENLNKDQYRIIREYRQASTINGGSGAFEILLKGK